MDTDQVAGRFKDVAGQAEAALGEAMGDSETQAKGRAREAAGVAQNLYGQARETIGEALEDATKSAEKVLHDTRDTVESGAAALKTEVGARPLIALLIAALVGYVIATLMHPAPRRR